MFNGPGKYDDAATVARESTKADGVILLVIRGEKGSGFSVQAPLDVIMELPTMLESIASQIRQQQANAFN